MVYNFCWSFCFVLFFLNQISILADLQNAEDAFFFFLKSGERFCLFGWFCCVCAVYVTHCTDTPKGSWTKSGHLVTTYKGDFYFIKMNTVLKQMKESE